MMCRFERDQTPKRQAFIIKPEVALTKVTAFVMQGDFGGIGFAPSAIWRLTFAGATLYAGDFPNPS